MGCRSKQMRYVIANWKMHGQRGDVAAYAAALRAAVLPTDVQVIICPPFTLLTEFAAALQNSKILIGAQNGHAAGQGAYTGEISMAQLANAGCQYVLVGHSERRAMGETDAEVKAKAVAAQTAGLTPVICVGESLAARAVGQAEPVVAAQLQTSCPVSGEFLVAYEPIWAIGTGRVPSVADIIQMHTAIHQILPATPVLYGGSVKPDNAAQIQLLPGVDGVLVGGASLDAKEFIIISVI